MSICRAWEAAVLVVVLVVVDRALAQNEPTKIFIHPDEQAIQFDKPQGSAALLQTTKFIRAGEARRKFRVTGNGLAVAVVDTGLNTAHTDFSKGLDVPARRNFTDEGEADDVTDKTGHGTNVAGIVVANGVHSGIAPGAKVVPLRVLKHDGSGLLSDVASALQWIIDNHDKYNITVVNLSLSDHKARSTDEFHNESIEGKIRRHIRTLRTKRIPVVIAAGNGFHPNSKQGMGFPAVVRECVSVGALYDADVGEHALGKTGWKAKSTAAGRITPFSQRLHPSFGVPAGQANPCRTDVFAPGGIMTSTGTKGENGSSTMFGTSQSAPVTAGVILLVQELHDRLDKEHPTVDEIETWLRAGPKHNDGDDEVDNVENTKLDYIRIDAYKVLDAAYEKIRTR